MAEGFRTFTFPVLLALPSSSDEKYRFLLSAYFEYAPSERAKVSGLEEAALAAVRLSARRLKIASDSTMSVGIYQVQRVLLRLSYLVHAGTCPTVMRTPSTRRFPQGYEERI
jgi:hypothetical protein